MPGPSDIVKIRHNVTYATTAGDADVIGIDAGGALRFATNQPTRLSVGTLIVLPNGVLEVGTSANPVPAGVTAEIVIKNKALNMGSDPDQFGTGLLTGNGTLTMHGAVKQPTWVRVSAEPQAGSTTLGLAEAVTGWQVGDVIVLPDSHEDPLRNTDAQVEKRTIQSISGDQRTVTLNAPLTYRHPAARNQTGAIALQPHVMNLTRNVVIRSENPAGTRGHTLHTDRSVVDVRYVEFRDLGRTTISPLSDSTNHIGRYAMHLHHLIGPAATPATGYQFAVIGNALHDTNAGRSQIKWPLAIHNSHYGLIQGNAIYNAGGSGLVTEDGNESFNVIERNMVARVTGNGDRNGHKEGGVQEPGSQGIGLWFHGGNNYVRNNVGANATESTDEAGYGFELYQEFVGTVRIPNYKGASTDVAGQYTDRSIYTIPVLEFSGNEAYGNPQGMTYWWVGMEFHSAVATQQSVFRDTRLWHNSRYPIYGYQGAKITFDGLEVYGDQANVGQCCRAIWWSDYLTRDLTIRRATIVGIGSLMLPYAVQGTTTVEDSFIATGSGIVNITSGAPGDCPNCSFPNRAQVFRNVRFAALPGRSLRTITMEFQTHDGHADLASRDEVFVYGYQGQAGNDFRVYYREQANQNVAGGLAPCTNTTGRPEVSGITCSMTGTPPTPGPPTPPPPGPVACTVSGWSGWQPVGSWSACINGAQFRTEQRTRSIVTAPSNGGAACPALVENRTVSQACTSQGPSTPEVCGDGVDNDGDGLVDENCTPGANSAPSAPRRLAGDVLGSTVNLSWRSPISGGTPTEYVVDAGLASGQTLLTFSVGQATGVNIPGAPAGKFFVRIRALNERGSSDSSNEVAVSVGCSAPPGAPRQLTSATQGSAVTLTWVDPDGCNDTGYHMMVGAAPGTANLAQAVVHGSELSALAPPGTYYARVSTLSQFGETQPSNEVQVVIAGQTCMAPAFPMSLDMQVAGRFVSGVWRPADEAAALAADDVLPISYVLEVGVAPGTTAIGIPMGRTTSLLTQAPPGTYYARIRPVNACGAGPASNEFVLQIQ